MDRKLVIRIHMYLVQVVRMLILFNAFMLKLTWLRYIIKQLLRSGINNRIKVCMNHPYLSYMLTPFQSYRK